MNPPAPIALLYRFAALSFLGAATSPRALAVETLRYTFEDLTTISDDGAVTNTAPGASQGGLLKNTTNKIALTSGQQVLINGLGYELGKSLKFTSADAENATTGGYVDTGRNPLDWMIANASGANLQLNRSYTIMAWVKFDNPNNDNMIIGQLGINNSIHLGTRVGNYHSGHWASDLVTTISSGTDWHHLTFTNEGATNTRRIYRNGVQVAFGQITAAPPSAGNITNMIVGNQRTGAGQGTGSFVGSLDELKVFSDEVMNAAEITVQMTNTLVRSPLAGVGSARLDNGGYTFTIEDVTPGSSIVNPSSVVLMIDGTAVAATVVKTGTRTTITYTPPSTPGIVHDWRIEAKDQTNPAQPNIIGSGKLSSPQLPVSFNPQTAQPATGWFLRTYRSATPVANLSTAVALLAASTPGQPEVSDSAPAVLNHSDPDDPGFKGHFTNDLPFDGHQLNGATPDDNVAFLGLTKIVVPTSGRYTFSAHSNDGFALRVGGGPVGNTGRFVSSNRNTTTAEGATTNGIDPSDPQTLFFANNTADSSTTGVYEFSVAGTYDVTMVAYENLGGAYHELAWVPGEFTFDRETPAWRLVGNPADSTFAAIPFSPRFLATVPGPAGGAGTWGVRQYFDATYYTAPAVPTILAASQFLNDNATPAAGADVVEFQAPRLNVSDVYNTAGDTLTSQGHIVPDDLLPDKLMPNDRKGVNNVITTAKARVTVAAPQVYTFNARGDDGFLLRVKAVSGAHPEFRLVTSGNANVDGARSDISNKNEMHFFGTTGDSLTRGIIFLPAGQYDLEYIHFEGTSGYWYELTAAAGEHPHGSEPAGGWKQIGFAAAVSPPANLPKISAAGWTVESTLPGAVTENTIAGAITALAAGATTSTWDYINFSDPQNAGTLTATIPAFGNAWPRDTSADDNNFAMRSKADLVISAPSTLYLGYQGDDGGALTIRGSGATPTPSFDEVLAVNVSGAGAVMDDGIGGTRNELRTQISGPNNRTIGKITLAAGTYTLEAISYEITGGAYFTVVGGVVDEATPIEPTTPLFPLAKNGFIPDTSVLPIIAQPGAPAPTSLKALDFTYNAATGAFALKFESRENDRYQLEYTTDMAAGPAGTPAQWNVAPAPLNNIIGNDGDTTATGNIAALKAAPGVLPAVAPRVFMRIRRL